MRKSIGVIVVVLTMLVKGAAMSPYDMPDTGMEPGFSGAWQKPAIAVTREQASPKRQRNVQREIAAREHPDRLPLDRIGPWWGQLSKEERNWLRMLFSGNEQMREESEQKLVALFEMPESGDINDSALFRALNAIMWSSGTPMETRLHAASAIAQIGGQFDAGDSGTDFLEAVLMGDVGDPTDGQRAMAATEMGQCHYGSPQLMEMLEDRSLIVRNACEEALVSMFVMPDSGSFQDSPLFMDIWNLMYDTSQPLVARIHAAAALYKIAGQHDAADGASDLLEAVLMGEVGNPTDELRALAAIKMGEISYGIPLLMEYMGDESPLVGTACEDALVTILTEHIDPNSQTGQSIISDLMDLVLGGDPVVSYHAANVLKRVGIDFPRG